jgi:hypothetical protein
LEPLAQVEMICDLVLALVVRDLVDLLSVHAVHEVHDLVDLYADLAYHDAVYRHEISLQAFLLLQQMVCHQ